MPAIVVPISSSLSFQVIFLAQIAHCRTENQANGYLICPDIQVQSCALLVVRRRFLNITAMYDKEPKQTLTGAGLPG